MIPLQLFRQLFCICARESKCSDHSHILRGPLGPKSIIFGYSLSGPAFIRDHVSVRYVLYYFIDQVA